MFKREYFLMCMKEGLWRHKRWIIEAFAVTEPGEEHPYRYGLHTDPKGRYYFYDGSPEDPLIYIDDAMPGEALFAPLEKIILQQGDLANVTDDVVTTYGNALVNQMVLVYAFNDKIPFVTGQFSISAIEQIIQQRWDDDAPEEGLPPHKQPLRTDEYKRFNEGIAQTPGLTQLCVPSATRKTMTADPAMIKRRDELLEQHKHELNDKVVLSKIMAELSQMDRDWMKGDPGERFYISAKAYDVSRMKLFIMQGISTGFGQVDEVITSSLDEGWDIEKLPAMNNQLRDGSYSRGALTALGGVTVKLNNRIFQNSVVTQRDCGTKRGVATYITTKKINAYVGYYRIVGGKSEMLSMDSLLELVGKTIIVRNPAYCRTAGVNFCACCVGENIAATPQALGTYAADIGSVLMYAFMKKMHGKSLKTQRLNYETWLS